MWVSTRVGRGTYVSVGSSGFATVLLFVAALVGLVQLYFALLGVVLTVILAPLCVYLESRRAKREFEDALRKFATCSVEPASIVSDGNYTQPRTWGVYQVEKLVRGIRAPFWHFGNHPVRQEELIRQYGALEVIYLFTSRADAEEFTHLLNSRVRKVIADK